MTCSANIYYPTGETERLFIKGIWQIEENSAQEITETILPKGTAEIIFNLSDKITYINQSSGCGQTLPYCFINGINLKPLKLIKKGQQKFIGLQLSALGLKVLFDLPARTFNDNIYDGWLVCKSLETLSYELFSKKSFNEQVNVILKWIYERVSVSKANKTLPRIFNIFYSNPSPFRSVKSLCNAGYFSERHLRRLSNEWLGMNSETFLLYNKYLTALHLLHRPKLSLTRIGLDVGYYDQSHFIREFKSFTNLTPTEYRATSSLLPGHIIG